MILNEDEVKIKTIRWMREHAEYLKELKGLLFIALNFSYLLFVYLCISYFLRCFTEKEEKKAKELLENPKSFKKVLQMN